MSLSSFDPGALTALDFGTPGHIYRSPMPFGQYDPQGHLITDSHFFFSHF